MAAAEHRTRRRARYWLRIVAASVAASLVVTVVFTGVTWHTPVRQMAEAFGVSLLFSFVIGPMLGVVMPRVGHAVACRFTFPLDWAILITTMVAIALAGSFGAILILSGIGYLHGAGIVTTWMTRSLNASIVITLTFGIFVTVMESMRRRLDETTLALRTKERDEADARRLGAEAQLAAIESRVQPHFLFNTLNSIAALAHDDPAGAERMAGQLASLMRSSLDASAAPLVPLSEELRMVRAYLEIERVRFGERLRYDIDVDEAAACVQVPRLAVQTVVENSVKYAVSPRREGGRVAVRASAAGSRVTVSVADDGPGFELETAPPGHGLALVRDRLAMTFGGRAALRVERRGSETRVSLEVPHDRSA